MDADKKSKKLFEKIHLKFAFIRVHLRLNNFFLKFQDSNRSIQTRINLLQKLVNFIVFDPTCDNQKFVFAVNVNDVRSVS